MNSQLKAKRREPNLCARCGSRTVVVRHSDDVVDFKGLTLEVSGLAETSCTVCNHTWTTDGQEQDNLAVLQRTYASKRDEVRKRDGLLTADQIEYVLTELRVSKNEAAAIFGGGPNAFNKYLRGDVLQSVPMDRLLRLTLGFGQHAVDFLKLGEEAPLKLYAACFMQYQVSGVSAVATWEVPANESVIGHTVVARTSHRSSTYQFL